MAMMRGAFVQFMQTFLLPAPNIILFQFNPAQLGHAWQPAEALDPTGEGDPLAVSGPPGESFQFTLQMDATDTIADGSAPTAALAKVSGLYPRLAALEMLMQPEGAGGGGLLGSVTAAAGGLSAALGGGAKPVMRQVPSARLPTVLFIWGPGRVVPVRVTSLSVNETLHDPLLLHPLQAEAQVSLQVLTERELQVAGGPLGVLARGAHAYTRKLREALAIANLANSAEAAIGTLPV